MTKGTSKHKLKTTNKNMCAIDRTPAAARLEYRSPFAVQCARVSDLAAVSGVEGSLLEDGDRGRSGCCGALGSDEMMVSQSDGRREECCALVPLQTGPVCLTIRVAAAHSPR